MRQLGVSWHCHAPTKGKVDANAHTRAMVEMRSLSGAQDLSAAGGLSPEGSPPLLYPDVLLMVKELVPGAWLNVWARMEGRRHAVQLIRARPRDCLAVRDGACSRGTTHSLPLKLTSQSLSSMCTKGE